MTSLMMSSGTLTHRATLDGSTEGVTCVEFDHTVSQALLSYGEPSRPNVTRSLLFLKARGSGGGEH